MNEEEIWSALQKLSKSQGFYGRLCRQIEESGQKEEILKEWASHQFQDIVDLVMWLEDE